MVVHSSSASTDRHLCCLQVLASVNSAAMNILASPVARGQGISGIPRGRVVRF